MQLFYLCPANTIIHFLFYVLIQLFSPGAPLLFFVISAFKRRADGANIHRWRVSMFSFLCAYSIIVSRRPSIFVFSAAAFKQRADGSNIHRWRVSMKVGFALRSTEPFPSL